MEEYQNYAGNAQRAQGYPTPAHGLNPAATVQRLRPQVNDHQIHIVAGILLDLRHSPCGELELASRIINSLDDYRYGPMSNGAY